MGRVKTVRMTVVFYNSSESFHIRSFQVHGPL